jgi:hypothetical protein
MCVEVRHVFLIDGIIYCFTMYVYSDVAIVQTLQVQVGEPIPISLTHQARSSLGHNVKRWKKTMEERT